MKYLRIILILLFSIGAFGCATEFPTNDYTAFHAENPRSILVVPILNEAVEVYASDMMVTSVPFPLGERGYYVFPIKLTDALLQDLGLPEAGLIHQLPPQKFYEHFGCDAVLFITIKDWSSKYILINNMRHIQARYLLVAARSGNVLWDQTKEISIGSGDGGGGLVGMAVAALVDKVVTEAFDSAYRDVARMLNSASFTQIGVGLPAGPYHQNYGTDQEFYPDK
jgi:hypothetical protein